jgi:hypothetical protein
MSCHEIEKLKFNLPCPWALSYLPQRSDLCFLCFLLPMCFGELELISKLQLAKKKLFVGVFRCCFLFSRSPYNDAVLTVASLNAYVNIFKDME